MSFPKQEENDRCGGWGCRYWAKGVKYCEYCIVEPENKDKDKYENKDEICNEKECKKKRIENGIFCEKHNCKSIRCIELCNSYGYCEKHTCKAEDCNNPKKICNNFCAKHGCIKVGCKKESRKETKKEIKEWGKKEGKMYVCCREHTCEAKYCKKPKGYGNYCIEHTCRHGSCVSLKKEIRDEFLDYCEEHVCKYDKACPKPKSAENSSPSKTSAPQKDVSKSAAISKPSTAVNAAMSKQYCLAEMETYQRHSVANQYHTVFTKNNVQFLANCLGVSLIARMFSRKSHRWHRIPPQELSCEKCSKKTKIYYNNMATCEDCHPNRPVLQSIIYPETECAKCETTMYATHRRCSKHLTPLREEYVVNMFLFDAYLEKQLKIPFVANKTYRETDCRPDIVFEFIKNKEILTIMVEIDENGHEGYEEETDSERTKNLLKSANRRLILIRYNPDNIANGDAVSVEDRYEKLLETIEKYSAAKYKYKKPLVCYMFYDTEENEEVFI